MLALLARLTPRPAGEDVWRHPSVLYLAHAVTDLVAAAARELAPSHGEVVTAGTNERLGGTQQHIGLHPGALDMRGCPGSLMLDVARGYAQESAGDSLYAEVKLDSPLSFDTFASIIRTT